MNANEKEEVKISAKEEGFYRVFVEKYF